MQYIHMKVKSTSTVSSDRSIPSEEQDSASPENISAPSEEVEKGNTCCGLCPLAGLTKYGGWPR
jgi:hypothetical protein